MEKATSSEGSGSLREGEMSNDNIRPIRIVLEGDAEELEGAAIDI